MDNEQYEYARRMGRMHVLHVAIGALRAGPDMSGRRLLSIIAQDLEEDLETAQLGDLGDLALASLAELGIDWRESDESQGDG
jgi:hypothetical protein